MLKIKPWEELTIRDNFLFQKVMLHENICKHFLEKLLDIKIKNINYRQYEKTIDLSPQNKTIRLDVYVETDADEVIDIEMQTGNSEKEWLAKRARYYGSMLDLSSLAKGKDYIKLKKSYVIFVCTFDPFDCERKLYTFRNACREENLDLNDGSEKIFLNTKGTKGKVDEDIDDFLKYVDENKINGDFVKNIADVVAKVKEHKELGVEYMSMMAEYYDQRRLGFMDGEKQGEKKGEKKGRIENIINNVRSLMKKTGWNLNETLSNLSVSPEDAAIVLKKI